MEDGDRLGPRDPAVVGVTHGHVALRDVRTALAADVLELRHHRDVMLGSNAGAGSPAPLPERMGIWPSIQVSPPSNDVKNPVGTSAWRAPVELLNR